MRIPRRFELCFPVLRPVMYDIKIPALLGNREVCVKRLLLLVPCRSHNAGICVAQ